MCTPRIISQGTISPHKHNCSHQMIADVVKFVFTCVFCVVISSSFVGMMLLMPTAECIAMQLLFPITVTWLVCSLTVTADIVCDNNRDDFPWCALRAAHLNGLLGTLFVWPLIGMILCLLYFVVAPKIPRHTIGIAH